MALNLTRCVGSTETLQRTTDVDQVDHQFLERILCIPTAHKEARQSLHAALIQCLLRVTDGTQWCRPAHQLLPFGSTATGLELLGADLDLAIVNENQTIIEDWNHYMDLVTRELQAAGYHQVRGLQLHAGACVYDHASRSSWWFRLRSSWLWRAASIR